MLAPTNGRGCVLVSSEPLSDDHGWQAIPSNPMVLVSKARTTSVQPIVA